MADLITVARPYAKAAFDFAVKNNQLKSWLDMLAFTSQVSQTQEIRSLLASDLKSAAVGELFIKICQDKVDEFQTNFIKLMAEKKRLSLLPKILILFEQLCLEKENKAYVDLISAKPLSNEHLEKIKAATEKRLSQEVILKCHIDKSIISGFILRTGDMVIDSSIRGRLNRLNDTLQF